MSSPRNLKRLARKRQQRTGESYTHCLMLVKEQTKREADTTGETLGEVTRRLLEGS